MKSANTKTRPGAAPPQIWEAAGVCLFLLLAVWAVFGQTAGFGFVDVDDNLYVYDNGTVTNGLTLQGIEWVFTHVMCNFYHPLTMISLMLDYRLHGLNAGGYHLTNVLIHAASSILLFLVLRRMTGAFWRSAFAAAVFAVHPLRAESVAWVTERKDVLAALFFMLTIGAYAHYARNPASRPRWLAVAGFFALGLLCKPTALALPFALLPLDWWPLNRFGTAGSATPRWFGIPKNLIMEKLPLAGLAAVAGAGAYFAQGDALISTAKISIPLRVANAFVSYVVYLREMFWPAELAFYYPYPGKSALPYEGAAALLLLAGVTAAVWFHRQKRPWLLVGWVWYLVMMVPAIGLVAVNPSSHGDRNTYLPQIGVCVMLAWWAGDWSAGWKFRRPILGGVMVLLVGTLMVCARNQTSYWKDGETLWGRVLAQVARESGSLNEMGVALYQKGQLDKAISEYHQALEINPAFSSAHSNLGIALAAKGNFDEAIAEYRRALELKPDYADARNNLALALVNKGKLDEAVLQYRKALELKPDYAEFHRNYGDALARQGNLDQAIAQYREALALQPNFAAAQNNLSNALLQKGDLEGAVAALKTAAALNPGQFETWHNLGNLLLQKGDAAQSAAAYRQALRTNPRSADTSANLGMALVANGETKAAIDALQEALEIAPGLAYVQNNLAWLLATTSDASLRDGAKALALATKASQASGNTNPVTLHTLAAAYAETGSYGLAAATARRAEELAAAKNNNALAAALRQEIPRYEAGQPMRGAARPTGDLKNER